MSKKPKPDHKPLPLPLWCFVDGPCKGQVKALMGARTVQMVEMGWRTYREIIYKPSQCFKGDNDRLVIVAKMIPQHRKRWAKCQELAKRPAKWPSW